MVTIEGMPKFGLSMEAGVVSEWQAPIGGRVSRGDSVATIESEKLVNSAKAPRDGVVLHYFLSEGDEAPCGAPLYALGDDGDVFDANACGGADEGREAAAQTAGQADPSPAKARATARARTLAKNLGVALSDVRGTGADGEITIDDVKNAKNGLAAGADAEEAPAGEVRATPRARMLAEKEHLSYNHIRGTGLLGMVTVADVKAHGKPITAETGGRLVLMNGVQRMTAVAMKKSLESAAQTTVCVEASYAPLTKAYRRLKPVYAERGVKLGYTAMIVKAAALVLAEREEIRLQYADASHFFLPAGIHIGVAVEIEKGLVVPVVRNADTKPLEKICNDIAALSEKARTGALAEGDMGGAVMTVTNLAMAGATFFTPILNPPESSILGVCAMRDQPIARDGGIYIEPVMNLCLTYDHRVINGAPACRFVQAIANRLNETDWQ